MIKMEKSPSEYVEVKVFKDWRQRQYVCKICGKTYFSRAGARIHVKRKHLSKQTNTK